MNMLNGSTHRQFISIDEYASGLARAGIPVLPGSEGTIWMRHDTGVMMRVPRFHLVAPRATEARQVTVRARAAVSSYLQEPDALRPPNGCLYVCADRAYGLERLSSAMRRNVRRGNKELKIAWLARNELFTHGERAYCDTRQRVGVADGNKDEFVKRFRWRTRCPGHVFLGAWRHDQLAAFVSLIEVDDWVEIESCYSRDDLLEFRPNDTLMYAVLAYYLRETHCRLVCYGLSSIQAENNASGLYAFKKKVGFDAPLVHRTFEIHALLRPFVNRLSVGILNVTLKLWPRARCLKKAEGLLAYMYGADRTPPNWEPRRQPLNNAARPL
jgi:hypothetical protein